jgi:muramoyltetrapeptide carboxypeptidase
MIKIRIVAPAKSIDKDSIAFAQRFLESQGFDVSLGKHLLGEHHYFSGTIEERLFDFQEAIDDPSVDFILCARGGYGAVQLIDQLDFSGLKKHPKYIIGYSDVTVFHQHLLATIQHYGIHATAPLNFAENSLPAMQSFVNTMEGIPNNYVIAPHHLNIHGEAEAPVIGGNLAIVYSLLGTNSDPDYAGKILFLEEIGEPVYSIDRMFYALKKAGKLSELKGVIIGGMTNMKDSAVPFGQSVETIIHNHIAPYQIPLCFGFPAGHIDDNRALIMGQSCELKVTDGSVSFSQKGLSFPNRR